MGATLFLTTMVSVAWSGERTPLPAPEEVLERVKAVYGKQCCFKAAFDQVTVNVAMNMKDRFRGTMYVAKPDRIALEVAYPEKQRVVVKGRSYIVHIPDFGNAARGEIPPDLNVENFFSFFTDINQMDENLDVRFAAKAFSAQDQMMFLQLQETGASSDSGTHRIILGVDRESYYIRRAIIYDALGNYNRFDLSDITLLSSLPEKTFQFNEDHATAPVPGLKLDPPAR
jgi:outer membrane lipoprotein-sorting protein